MQDNYIEVIGEAQYSEEPDTWIIDVTLNIQTANEDTLIAESREYKNKLVSILLSNNITEDELFYAGTDLYTPWWKKNRVGLNASHKVTIRTKDRYRAYKALERIEELNKISKRIVVQIDERKPFFKANDEEILNARKVACKNALIKAKELADAFNMDVGSPIEIQEIDKGVRASGNYGDNDWGGVYAVACGSSRSVNNEMLDEVQLKGNERVIYLRYRIKFALIAKQ